ncbi:MAG: imelysin family protein [Sandaracinaceae bacterium]
MSVRRLVLLALTGALLASCGPSEGGGEDSGPDTLAERKREILGSMTDRVLVPALRDFSTAADALEAATAAYGGDPSETNRDGARAAWETAMLAWQRLEVMQIGPIGMSGVAGVTAGEDLRDEVYSWPITSSCQIDQRTVEATHADSALLGVELVDARGLDAMEYLLFNESRENTCSTVSPINADGIWAGFTAEEIQSRRAVYAATAAGLVATQASALLTDWETRFAGELESAGDTSTVFDTAQAALNDLAGAMLYLDNEARDMKLGEPAGISGCPTAVCPEALELPLAARSREAVTENVRAFSLLYHGGAPDDPMSLGLHDLLLDLGQDTLATDMAAAIAAAITALEAIEGALGTAIEDDPAAVMSAYEAVGEAQRLFKVDVVTALDLEPSTPRVGDND